MKWGHVPPLHSVGLSSVLIIKKRYFERLGSPHNVTVDVRIIAATNRNLAEESSRAISAGSFLSPERFPHPCAALRDRTEIFSCWPENSSRVRQKMGRKISHISSQDMEMLASYPGPKCRELRNVVIRAMITSQGDTLALSRRDLPQARPAPSSILTLEEAARRHIEETLKATRGKIKGKGGPPNSWASIRTPLFPHA